MISENQNILNSLFRWDDSEVEFNQFPSWWKKTASKLWSVLSDPLERWCIASIRHTKSGVFVYGKSYMVDDDDAGSIKSDAIDIKVFANYACDWLLEHEYNVPRKEEYTINQIKSYLKRNGYNTFVKRTYKVSNVEIVEIPSGTDLVHYISNLDESGMNEEDDVEHVNDEIIEDLMRQKSIIEHKMKLVEKMRDGSL
jgi:hypothetical protein